MKLRRLSLHVVVLVVLGIALGGATTPVTG